MKKTMQKSMLLMGALMVLLFAISCDNNGVPDEALSPLAKKGKSVYYANCIACHNPNPRVDGSVGPAIAGSSFELVKSRVLTRSYPEGYKPKRSSELMPDFPDLEKDIEALHAYLEAFR